MEKSKIKVGITKMSGESSRNRECAKLYCEIWKESPWNESFWKEENVLEDIVKQLGKPSAEGFIALCDDMVIGFTWGYLVSRPEMQEIASGKGLDFLFANGSQIFYVDELGVNSRYRNQGVGTALTKNLLENASNCGINTFLLRTDEKAHQAKILYRKIGFNDLQIRDGKYPNRTYWVLRC